MRIEYIDNSADNELAILSALDFIHISQCSAADEETFTRSHSEESFYLSDESPDTGWVWELMSMANQTVSKNGKMNDHNKQLENDMAELSVKEPPVDKLRAMLARQTVFAISLPKMRYTLLVTSIDEIGHGLTASQLR